MKVYFVRHGATQNNQANTFNGGGVDSPLTTAGRQSAQRLGQYLRQVAFDAAYVSPQQRAQTTAQLILAENAHPVPAVMVTPLLREMALGDWDGTPIASHVNEPEYADYFDHPARFSGERLHAETYADVATRGRQALRQISHEQPTTANILVASHGLLLTSLLETLRGTPLDAIRQKGLLATASVTIMTTTDGQHFTVDAWAVKPED
ncbi:histidine phosphatase family protein [Levilactobacillus angrenensis]|uniref:Histidine phosphatase family protein n=1 Tax=Levilactobacillus angrenensis TaxID=2486020 RepID=A0ABW1U988_9LACO|nr:histidine phosphatase family protein [Levilactobacillus angrenensis]